MTLFQTRQEVTETLWQIITIDGAAVWVQKNGKRDVAFYQSVKRLPDISWKICFREIAAEIGQMSHRFHKHDKKQHEKYDKWYHACYQRQSKKKGNIKRKLV